MINLVKELKTIREIRNTQKQNKEYLAIGNNGNIYNARYVYKYKTMFYTIPYDVKVVGYKEC